MVLICRPIDCCSNSIQIAQEIYSFSSILSLFKVDFTSELLLQIVYTPLRKFKKLVKKCVCKKIKNYYFPNVDLKIRFSNLFGDKSKKKTFQNFGFPK